MRQTPYIHKRAFATPTHRTKLPRWLRRDMGLVEANAPLPLGPTALALAYALRLR